MSLAGVLSYQGGYARHLECLKKVGVRAIPVRSVDALERIDALIIPGGESTTIGMLMERFGVMRALVSRIADGFPVFGTCAGAILLASDIEDSDQPRIGALDMTVRRNAYGRQIESFEADVRAELPGVRRADDPSGPEWTGEAFHGVFIRAPQIVRVGHGVQTVLAFEGQPVLVRERNLLAATFHPELADDHRIHRYFLDQVAGL